MPARRRSGDAVGVIDIRAPEGKRGRRVRRTPRQPRPRVPSPPRRIGADELCARWRAALDAADGALLAGAESLPRAEVARARGRVAAERGTTLRLLRALARERGESGRFLELAPRTDVRRLLGLPAGVRACVFTLDGVLIGSATLHAAAWRQTFDELVWARTERTGGRFAPFDPVRDYREHLHARPRLDGVRAFLASRGMRLPEGEPGDPPGAETVHGLANRKNEILRRRIDEVGVTAYAGSLHYLRTAAEGGLRRAVVSASANTPAILARSGLAPFVDASVDGATMVAEHLRPKPAPDALLAACRLLGVEPAETAAFETTPAGVAAARAAGCACVVAVDQFGQAAALRAAGADQVVPGLAELLEQRLAA
jgi:HAD superfamily hydrolase (TIGR01509 family)